MRFAFSRSRKDRDAQTLVFFLVCWGTIMLLCGLAIDSGLLYLSKARLARAVDGSALAAVGNFNRDPGNPTQNRYDVSVIARNFAAANFTDLATIDATPTTQTSSPYTLPNGTTGTSYTYTFSDHTQDPNGQYRRFVAVTVDTGSGGAITSANVNARCPVPTFFIGYGWSFLGGVSTNTGSKIGGYSGPSSLVDLKVSSSAVATRNPRLIMVVIDRSASMLETGGGASGLPPAVVQFLDFFDTTSDTIGIVSFGTAARLEMPLTTNFLIAGTNNLIDAYDTNASGTNQPGVDPEQIPTNSNYDPNYNFTGVRRLKFGGSTAADDGIRLAMEQLYANSGFTDPDVLKYMVIFTDGQWNTCRTLSAAPGYTNEITAHIPSGTDKYVTNTTADALASGASGIWSAATNSITNGADSAILPVPTLSPMPTLTNSIMSQNTNGAFSDYVPYHTNDFWISKDASGVEPITSPSATPSSPTAYPLISTDNKIYSQGGTNYYTHNLDVWLQPGAVAYDYETNSSGNQVLLNTYVSNYNKPTQHLNVKLLYGGKLDLVVPGYVLDGTLFDGLDLEEPDNNSESGDSSYPRYRADNYQQPYMFCDETPGGSSDFNWQSSSLERALLFRNYANLLTGYYVSRPDYPIGSGYEPLITEDNPPGAPRSRDGLGAYYPGAAFYFPFGGETDTNGYVTNAVGVAYRQTYSLLNPNVDPDPDHNLGQVGGSRHNAYSINMLSSNAAPEWAGELFYESVSGAGTNTISGNSTTSASSIMTTADWKAGAPSWVTGDFDLNTIMASDATHDTNITPNPSVWRPASFVGTKYSGTFNPLSPPSTQTGGMTTDGTNYYVNSMAWSSRPTHYFDFSKASWEPIPDNHHSNQTFLQLGNWKAWEYAWHARALGVTIYTVGYGTAVSDSENLLLAQIANATNVALTTSSSNISYNPNQPIGEQFYATNATQISNDFYSVGQAINAALTQ